MAHMVQSVELIVDDAADNAVRQQWELLSKAGLPTMGAVTAETNRPHITVAVAGEIWPRIDHRLSTRLDFEPFPIRLGAVMVFGGKRAILVRLVVPSEPLLALHKRVFDVVSECPHLAGHTRPGEWTPHITLARHVRTEQLGAAISTVLGAPEVNGEVVAVRRWDGTTRREWRVG